MIHYYAKFAKQADGSYLVEFPDLPGCLTEGRTQKQALQHAKEALDGWLAAHCDRLLDVPKPRKRQGGNFHPIEVDIQVAFVIELRRLRKKKGLSQSAVAKRLGISQQAYAKLETPLSANPSLTTIQKLSEALDAELEIKLVA